MTRDSINRLVRNQIRPIDIRIVWCSAFVLLLSLLPTTMIRAGTPVWSGSVFDQADSTDIEIESDSIPERHLKLSITPGVNLRVTPGFDPEPGLDYVPGGLLLLGRLSLVPEHLLKIGLESGLFRVTTVNDAPSSNESPDRIVLTAFPAFFTLSMGDERFEAGGGIGYYRLIVDAGEERLTDITSSGIELGFMLNATYVFPLSDRFDVGLDLHLFQFTDRPITTIALGGVLRMDLLSL